MAMDIQITFDLSGRMKEALRARAGAVVEQTAHRLADEAKTLINTPGRSGRVYGSHQASAAGEPPAADTGVLAGSIQSRLTGPLSAEVTVGAEYGHWLEFGTTRIEPRPFMVPAAETVKPEFVAAMQAAVREATRG